MQTKQETMIPTAQPVQTSVYEVCPRTPPQLFKRQFLDSHPILIESFCMKEHIAPDRLPSLIDDVLTDWELSEETHRDRKDAVKHLINHIRTKLRNEQRNNQSATLRTFARPNQNADERMADIARELIRQSSRRNQP